MRKVGDAVEKDTFFLPTSQEHAVHMCTCMLFVFARHYSLVRTRVFEMRVC